MQKVQRKVQTSVQYQKQDKPHLEAPFIMMGHQSLLMMHKKKEPLKCRDKLPAHIPPNTAKLPGRQYRWIITPKYSESNWHNFAGKQVKCYVIVKLITWSFITTAESRQTRSLRKEQSHFTIKSTGSGQRCQKVLLTFGFIWHVWILELKLAFNLIWHCSEKNPAPGKLCRCRVEHAVYTCKTYISQHKAIKRQRGQRQKPLI